ncbi:MAG: PA14 domain-containing protein [Planctomycetales bacterium]|nr:PA14 domain-containing protein [Planctomycetales bacterium]
MLLSSARCALVVASGLLLMLIQPVEAQQDLLKLEKGDHIAIIGNTLADRLQHYGHLEATLHYRFPEHNLVVRDLGFSGDTLTERPRSDNFGSPDEWLNKVQADVIIAFFGYNESYAGEAGLPQFRKDLEAFIDHTLAQKYNGESAPRLVLCSPIAFEDLKWPHLPDGKVQNKNIELYTAEMGKVASEKAVLFVDLFHHSQEMMKLVGIDGSPLRNLEGQKRDRFGFDYPDKLTDGTIAFFPLTINGVHITETGSQGIAIAFDRQVLVDKDAPQPEIARFEAIRNAVLAKNHIWHNVYRATDGYSVFGGRSGLQFVDGQTNFDVMKRELEILEVMTANRDAVIWAAAQGKDIKPDDSNLPKPLEVKTNKPGELEDGRHKFLGAAEAIDKMTIHQGMKVNVFASEEMFSDLVNPVQSAVDPDGRLWVAAWPTYPHWNPLEAMNDKLLIFPDDNNDGVADGCITFADGLHNPTGFEFWNGGVLVAMAPDIFFLKDTDGDDRADVKERIFHGLDSADTHHTANAFVMSPGGKFYFSRGIFHAENFETPWGPTKRFGTGGTGVYEWDPVTFDINFHFPIGPNPHGDVFDQWGNQFATDGTGGTGNYIGMPGHGAPTQLYEKRVRPVPAIQILDSQHFLEENRGNLLIANVIGFQGVTQYKFEKRGAGFFAKEVEPILYSSDQNFRPSDMEIGGDGALYVLDWQNPIIGHMQHNLRDPSRDHLHGRIYRVTAEGRDTQPVLKLDKASTADVVAALGSETLAERYRARLELTSRNPDEVIAAVNEWVKRQEISDPENSRNVIEALWTFERCRVAGVPELFHLIKVAISSKNVDAKAAAVRVIRNMHTEQSFARTPEPEFRRGESKKEQPSSILQPKGGYFDEDDLRNTESAERVLLQLSSDSSPQVRAETVVAATHTRGPLAAEIIFAAMQTEQDPQLTYVINEARGIINLDAAIRDTLARGEKLSRNAEAYALSNASVEDLLKMEKTEGVYRAILTRENVPVETLQTALTGLAKLRKVAEIEELFTLIEELNAKASVNVLNSLSQLLASQPTDQLAKVRDRIATLATTAKSGETRRVAMAAWISADNNGDAVFAAVEKEQLKLEDALRAVSLVSSAEAKSSLFDRLAKLVPTLAGSKGSTPLTQPGLRVDFYAPSPSNVARETLQAMIPANTGVATTIVMDQPVLKTRDAFALMFTGHIVIDKPGKYTFFIASDDGSRFYIDGEQLIDNDGLHGMVEKSGTVQLTAGLHPIVATYFDNGGGDGLNMSWSGPGLEKQEIPANVLVSAAEQTVQDLGIAAIMDIPGNEAGKTTLLASLLKERASVNSSLQSLSTIPVEAWPKEQLGNLAEAAVSFLASREPKDRNSDQAQLALKIAEGVRTRLDDAGRVRFEKRLSEVVVPLIALGTVRERMIYDRETVAVQAGRPVEFRLTNTDNMPHNFAVVLPGTMAEVGELAEATGRDADAAARQFIPRSEKILVASKLVQPEQTDSIFFEVPKEPGIYPYVCTYPGHWRRMYGALYVVADLKAYEADPAAYLAANKLEMKDDLLKYLGRNTDWQLDDLKGDVMHLSHRANNFAVGQQLFKAAACVGCHKLNGQGNNVGPDLTKLPPEYSKVDVLEHILNPSKKVDKKYQSNVISLTSGKVLTGLIVEETGDSLRLIDNPSAPDKITVVLKTDIEERTPSEVSIMPKGVLNKLTREEIFDLLAYVLGGGDKENALFKGHEH